MAFLWRREVDLKVPPDLVPGASLEEPPPRCSVLLEALPLQVFKSFITFLMTLTFRLRASWFRWRNRGDGIGGGMQIPPPNPPVIVLYVDPLAELKKRLL